MILALVCIVMWAVFFGLLRLTEHVRSRHHSGSTRTDVFVPFHVTPYTQQKEDNHAA